MRRVRQQCGAQRSTEAIAQPAARRPEAQRRGTPRTTRCFTSGYNSFYRLLYSYIL
ncbi:MAG: hypothetical protein NZ455_02435 [Bacteroidia bacterium]|nr:hypothetical protein [Bacteroidia bacterium]